MKRFKTLICICLILIVVSSMAIVIGRYAISKNVTESSSEMQIAESKKNAEEVADYDDDNSIKAKWIDSTLRITDVVKDNDEITAIPDDYKYKMFHLIIESNGIGIIKRDAFKNCNILNTVYLKSGVSKIEEGAFYGNEYLETVILSENVSYIGKNAFANCKNLTKVIIQGNNRYIEMEDNSFDKERTIIYCKPSSSAKGCATYHGFRVVADGNAPDSIWITKKDTGANGWTSGKVVFEYGGGDVEAGIIYGLDMGLTIEERIKSTFYFEGCHPEQDVIRNATFKENASGYFCVEDALGNVAKKKISVTNIDTENPYIDYCGEDRSYTGKGFKLKVEAYDDESGLNEDDGAYSFDGGLHWQTENYKIYTEDTKDVVVAVRDKAYNYDYSSKIDIDVSTGTSSGGSGSTGGSGGSDSGGSTTTDTTKPSITGISGNARNWTKNDVTITVAASDASGIKEYSFDNGTTWQASNKKSFSSNQGVNIKVKDNANNISSATYVGIKKIDKTAPKIVGVDKSTTKYTKRLTLIARATDTQSGIAAYSFDNGSNWIESTSTIYPMLYTSNQSSVKIKVKDTAGNVSAATAVTIDNIDNEKPKINSVTGNATDWTNKDVTLTVAASDDNKLNRTAYSFNNGDTWQASNKKSFSSNQTVYIKVRDEAENISDVKSVVINRIDKTKPTIDSVTGNPVDWTNKDVTLTINASDTVSGLHSSAAYSFDGGNTWQASNQKSFSSNRIVYMKVRDKAGNISDAKSETITKIDKTPPTVKITGNPTAWTNKDATLKIDASDMGAGLNTAQGAYSFDGGTTWSNNTSKVYISNTNGIVIKVRDNVGNITTNTINITKIDKTVPGILKVDGNPTEWTKNSAKLTASATSNGGSEVIGYSFTNDASKTDWQPSNQKEFTSNQTVYVRAKDEAGNISLAEKVKIINVDQIKPTVKITGNPTSWTNKDVTLTITASDAESGLHSMPYSFDGGKTWSDTDTKVFTKNQVVNIQVRDKVGNIYETSVTISKIDKILPTVDVTGNPADWTKNDVTLTITASDAESGLNTAQGAYSFDGGTTWSNTTSKVYTKNTNGIIIKVRDAAGNITTNTLNITKIDKDAPTISSVVKNPDTWTTGNVTLIVTATDAGCGLHDTPYSFDGGKTWQKETSKVYTENTKNIVIKVRDKLENIATYDVVNITNIDRTPPVISSVTGNPKRWTNQDVTLKITATDAGCGLHATPYSFDGGKTWQKEASKIYKENTKNIVIKVKDKLGNTSTYSTIDITKIDKTVPTVIKVDGNPTEWTNGPVTLTVTITGNCGSCIISYSFDDGKTWQTSNKKTFANNQEVVIKVKDEAGNMSPSYNVSITKIRTAPDISIKSDVYEVDEVNINRVRQKTTVATFAEKIMHNASMKVYTKDNKELKDTDIIGTGMTAKFTLNGEEKTLNIVVTGDLTGDGKVTNSDMLRIARYMTGKEKGLDEIYLMASDVFEDNKYPNCVDLLKMARALVGLDKI